MTTLSVLFGTHNRRPYLERCVESIRQDLRSRPELQYEIVVADGASTDGSREWLLEQPDCRLVEGGLDGAVKAFNAAFAAAQPADYYALLNDDCLLLGPALTTALACFTQQEQEGTPGGTRLGLCAIPFHRSGEAGFRFDQYTLVPGIFANFGVLRGSLARGIARICGGLWAPCYRTYAGDCELAYWVYKLGWSVFPLPLYLGVGVEDLLAQDVLREENTRDRRWQTDAHVFRNRWPRRLLRNPDETMWLKHTTIEKDTLDRYLELRNELRPPTY